MSKFKHTVYVDSMDICLEIECELEYIPEEGDGFWVERFPESAELHTAKIGSIDIYDALTEEQVKAIEHDALVASGNEMAQQEAERRWERLHCQD